MDAVTYDFEFWAERYAAARRMQYLATRLEEKAKGRVQSNSVCRYWLDSYCAAGDRCAFSHVYDIDRVDLCMYFVKNTRCAEGAACKWRHYRHPGERDTAVRFDPIQKR